MALLCEVEGAPVGHTVTLRDDPTTSPARGVAAWQQECLARGTSRDACANRFVRRRSLAGYSQPPFEPAVIETDRKPRATGTTAFARANVVRLSGSGRYTRTEEELASQWRERCAMTSHRKGLRSRNAFFVGQGFFGARSGRSHYLLSRLSLWQA